MGTFKLQTEFEPAGDQVAAIAKKLVEGSGERRSLANICSV